MQAFVSGSLFQEISKLESLQPSFLIPMPLFSLLKTFLSNQKMNSNEPDLSNVIHLEYCILLFPASEVFCEEKK